MKVLPANMGFEQALRAGLVGRIECRAYLDWLKTLPCATCGAPPPSDPSHVNAYKGMGTKSPDIGMAIPQCRACHDLYELGRSIGTNEFLHLGLMHVIQAFTEGRLTWKRA